VVALLAGWARHSLSQDDVSAWVQVLAVGVCLAFALPPEEQ
jgi:hypothetical protein